MNKIHGRHSKVIELGLQNRVSELRARGLTHKQIVDELREENPDIDISYSSIRRYLLGIGIENRESTPSELVDDFNLMIQDFIYKVNLLQTISKGERQALRHFITSRKRSYEKKLYKAQGIEVGIDYEQRIDWLTGLSRCLCIECRKRINTELIEVEKAKGYIE